MVDDVCIVNERLQPGKVQQVLGWTKPHYFGDERLGSLPNVLDVADDSLTATAIIGARRCAWWVYEGHGAGYRQLLDFVEPDERISVLRTRTNGYLDLEVVGWTGPEALREVFRFDGSRYVGTGLEPVR
ncbi:hypothetical protein CKO25_14700 [Thiocapsa imhoffii]|uniref:Uncharacterized protein n=1 Tax=Thiocapsa imhoffii TaxID=382777 RepID=A0A9X1BA24_9GAMM|nr:hypothetical protein [Thiocapsa imhoffii]MBK1645873.1 hypothetical protein [Thiocapsa imhoffii]